MPLHDKYTLFFLNFPVIPKPKIDSKSLIPWSKTEAQNGSIEILAFLKKITVSAIRGTYFYVGRYLASVLIYIGRYVIKNL